MVKLYSTHCPKCHVIETKLGQKGIEFELIDNTDDVIKFGTEHNIASAPILVDGDNVMDFMTANKWIASK